MKLGAQLYTVREFCRDLDGFAETLKKVADMGYTTVQVSGTCQYDARWLKRQLDRNGLRCVITHIPPQQLREDLDQVCRDHQILNCGCVGLGWYGFTEETVREDYAGFLKIYKPIAGKLRDQGLYFMYHNHAQEFIHLDGSTLLERMAQDFTADEMGFTLDTFWIQAGGANSADYIRALKGRVPCIHLKDFRYSKAEANREKMAVVGEGNINFAQVIQAAADAGTEYLLVEQDDCHGEDPFACLKRSYDNLRAMGLE